MQSAVPSRHPKYRTKLCRNLANGNCPFGQKCSFFHPAPRISPSSSSPPQHLFNWNPLLLSQLLALSYQQGAQKEMPRRMPRRSLGSQLIDEDPSPTTPLLLSKSDCTSSEQKPQTRRSRRREKFPCRHFIRTGGWCPAAGQCRFHHDVTALVSEDVQKVFATNAHGGERTISGGVLMGMQVQSPPVINEAHSEPPRYPETELVHPYNPMYWSNYTWQPYQPYYAALPATAAAPIPSTAAPPPVMQNSVYPPPQPQTQIVPSSETQNGLPSGSYEMNGTTYFPPSMPSALSPPPMTSYSIPAHPVPYNHPMAPVYPYYAPPSPTRNELPVIPRLEEYQMSPIQHDALPLPLSSPFALNDDLGLTTTTGKPTVTQEHEFPYRPPKNQRVGHARRISVNIKKQGRANSG
ncbi:hypothetical protein HD554DRAFT_2176539 [Boletus coccyginus]|nr:hypothetical protein HD554DRAFT_2176539 [Boletus coccyginus]